jgi:hypothetical protein
VLYLTIYNNVWMAEGISKPEIEGFSAEAFR